MRLKDEICLRCSLPNYYDTSIKHIDGDPFKHYCTYCKKELVG